MTRYDKRVQALAVGLSALAGYVDALAFVHLGGFFVSFMSGNSTRFAVSLVNGTSSARIAFGLIGLFVTGVVSGSIVSRLVRHHRRSKVLGFVSIILTMGATANVLGFSHVAVAAMAIAMGAENAVFEEDGETRIGLTYMTGALVKIGQRVAGALLGGARFAWSSHLLLWAGFVGGAVAGAVLYPVWHLDALWLAVGAAAIGSFAAFKIEPA
jgi:uncharacterized membrane protein YoaK (UPF0700 family)